MDKDFFSIFFFFLLEPAHTNWSYLQIYLNRHRREPNEFLFDRDFFSTVGKSKAATQSEWIFLFCFSFFHFEFTKQETKILKDLCVNIIETAIVLSAKESC